MRHFPGAHNVSLFIVAGADRDGEAGHAAQYQQDKQDEKLGARDGFDEGTKITLHSKTSYKDSVSSCISAFSKELSRYLFSLFHSLGREWKRKPEKHIWAGKSTPPICVFRVLCGSKYRTPILGQEDDPVFRGA